MNGDRTYTILFDDLDSDPGETLALLKQLVNMAGPMEIHDALVVKTASPRVITILDALFPDTWLAELEAIPGNGHYPEGAASLRQPHAAEVFPVATVADEWQTVEGKPAKKPKAPKKEYDPRPCAGCGEMFTPSRSDQQIASGHKSCRIKVSNEQYQAKKASAGSGASSNGSTVRSDLAEVFRHHSGPIKAVRLG